MLCLKFFLFRFFKNTCLLRNRSNAFVAKENVELAVPQLFWPVINCIKLGGHVAQCPYTVPKPG